MRDTWCPGKATPETPFRYCTPWRETPGPAQNGALPEDPIRFPIGEPVSLDDFIETVWRVNEWSYILNVNPRNAPIVALSERGTMRPRSWDGASVTQMAVDEEFRLGGNKGCEISGQLPPDPPLDGGWSVTFLGTHQYYPPAGDDDAFFRPAFNFSYTVTDNSVPNTWLDIHTVGFRAIEQGAIVGVQIGIAVIELHHLRFTCGIFAGNSAALIGLSENDYPTADLRITATDWWRRKNKAGDNPIWGADGQLVSTYQGKSSESPDTPFEMVDPRLVRDTIFMP